MNWDWEHAGIMRRAVVGSLALRFAAPLLQADRAVVFVAVRTNGLALAHASADLRADRTLVLSAIQQNGFALDFAALELQRDAAIALEAVRENGRVLGQVLPEHQANRAVVLAAVQQNGEALAHASQELRADFVVVLCAVLRSSGALRFASKTLRRDPVLELVAWWASRESWAEIWSQRSPRGRVLARVVHAAKAFATRSASVERVLAQDVLDLQAQLGRLLDGQRLPLPPERHPPELTRAMENTEVMGPATTARGRQYAAASKAAARRRRRAARVARASQE